MATQVYSINKGINKPIEFRGLKAQYIGYLAAVVVGGLVGFGLLYACGISVYVCTPLTLGLGGWMAARIFSMSKQFGQHGLMKKGARKRMPSALLSRSRRLFIQLYRDYVRADR
jgi:hypothetical protein